MTTSLALRRHGLNSLVRVVIAVGMTIGASAFVPQARSQCAFWPFGEITPVHGPSNHTCAVMWDPDGGGPLAAVLTLGGYFGVFTWDGQTWRELGNPVADTDLEDVLALTVHNGTLIAGGTFLDDNTRRVAWWTGNGWAPLGIGLGHAGVGAPNNVAALRSFNGDLVAIGRFDLADGAPATNAAIWNGAAWLAMGELSHNGNSEIAGLSLEVFDADGLGPNPAQLYAGTDVNRVFRWENIWANVTSNPLLFDVAALTVHGGKLVAGGVPFQGLPPLPPVTSTSIWQWPPQWETVPGGSVTTTNEDWVPQIRAMLSVGSTLYVGGRFESSGGAPVGNIMRVVSGGGLPMGGGLPTSPTYGGLQVRALAAAIDGSSIFAAGDFQALADGTYVGGAAGWDGVSWRALAPATIVHAITQFGSSAAVGGLFEDLLDNSANGYANPAVNIALWNGLSMSRLGTGTNGAVRGMRAFAPSPTVNSLVVGGDFTNAGGVAVNRIARYDQSSTNPLQTGWLAMGSGFNAPVHAVELGSQGVIVAAGEFTASGATGLQRMARWSTSLNQWLPFATGGGADMNGTVRAMKVYTPTMFSTVMVAGGDFTTANNLARNRIAIWTEDTISGTTPWAAMGPGFNGSVHAIERHSGSIYAGGSFTATGDGATTLNRIARYAGSTWLPVGNGIGFNGTVRALRTLGGFLYAAGDFTSVDGVVANRIARWNGTSWGPVAGGVAGERYALAVHNGELLVGGRSVVGGGALPFALARYSNSGMPAIVQQPAPVAFDCGALASIGVVLPAGYNGFTYQWRRDGVHLNEGPTGSGSVISSGGGYLNIENVQSSDAGSYDCVITSINGCGSITSAAATLTITSACCPADVNDDGVVNVTDLLAVIGAWGACVDCAADVNRDDVINVTDLLAVIGQWGTCP